MADITDNLTGDPLATSDLTTTGSTDPVAPIAISLDQADADYAPGETVGITTNNVVDGGTFTFQVAHLSAGADGVLGTADDVLTYDLTGTGTPWTVTDGGAGDLDGVVNGSIQTSWYVNGDAANQAFMLTATDQASGQVATANFTDAPKPPPPPNPPPYDLTFQNTVTINGALFSSSNVILGAGTGLLDPFSQVQAQGNNTTEQGYNTDFNAALLDNAGKGGTNFIHSLNIADLPIQFVNGVGYYRFDLDINESNTGPEQNLSLDSLQIWQASVGNLSNYDPGANPEQGTGVFPTGTKIYDMDAGGDTFVGLNGELQPGSGNTTDMSFLVPVSAFDPSKPFIYLYSAFGFQDGAYKGPLESTASTWTADSGFEEWNRQIGQVIDGHKFNDLNADHIWEAGEPALAGWKIYLDVNNDNQWESGEPFAVTDVNGYYKFTVTPGTYTIREVPQAGWTQDAPNNAEGEYTVTVAAGQNSHNNDFGNFQLSSISGHKYADGDGNLATTGDQTAVSGWTISLYKDADHDNTIDSGEFVAQTTTNGSGFYQFTNLLPGDYLIQEESKSGWVNVSPVTINQNSVASGQNLTNQDFVNFKLFDISGTKFLDANGDGKTDGDVGLGNFTIFVDENGNGKYDDGSDPAVPADPHAVTAADGTWSITGLGIDDLGKTVYEVNQAGYVQTLGAAGYVLAGTSQDQDDLNFANFKLFDISGTKFLDANGDGKTDGDVGLGNFTIFVDENGNGKYDDGSDPAVPADPHAVTAADGTWSITGLGIDDLGKTVYEVNQAGYVQTLGAAGHVLAGTSQDQDDLNFANFKLFDISGTKFLDANGDGKTDGDVGLGNFTIFVDENGNGKYDDGSDPAVPADPHAVTAADGTWSITGLGIDDLGKTVYEVNQAGYVQTLGAAGHVLAGTSQDQDDLNFANFKLFDISGTKFLDANGDGKTDGDVGLGNFTIFVDENGNGKYDDGSDPAVPADPHAVTAADGTWSITGLGIDDLGKTVYEVNQAGYVQTLGAAGHVLAGTSQDQDDLNFANFKLFDISGTKFLDANGDGKTDGDVGLGNFTIFVDENGNGKYDDGSDPAVPADPHAVTAADGTWSITGLGIDDLGKTVYEVNQAGYVQTLGAAGHVLAGTSQDQDDLNFANFKLFDISGTKFLDANGDGKTDGDVGLGNFTIFVDENGNGKYDDGSDPAVPADPHAVTAADGTWSITGLGIDDLGKTVYEVNQAGYVQTLGAAGHVLAGTSQDQGDLNFANFKLFDISGTKFLDANGDGKTDGDVGLGNFTIFVDENGNGKYDDGSDPAVPADPHAVTAADGTWSITGLGIDDLGKTVYEVNQPGYVQTLGAAGYVLAGTSQDQTGLDFANFLPPAGQGLTPGFWKNHIDILNQELGEFNSAWNSKTSFVTIFGLVDNKIPGTLSIADALGAKGGGINHLERSSAAAYLSAAVTAVPDGPGGKPELNFSFSAATSSDPAIISILNLIDANHDHTLQPGEVAGAVRDVLNDGNASTSNFGLTGQPGVNDIANAFDAMNNQPHPDASVFLV